MKYHHFWIIASLASATTSFINIPTVDTQNEVLQTRIAQASLAAPAKFGKLFASRAKAIEKLMEADAFMCKSILLVNHKPAPMIENGLARYEGITSSLGELSLNHPVEYYTSMPNMEEMARIMGHVDFQFAQAETRGHDCMIVDVGDGALKTCPRNVYSIYESISKIYPEIIKVVFNTHDLKSSQFLNNLPCKDTQLCFLTKAQKDGEETKLIQAATEKVVNEKIAAEQAKTIGELNQQLTIERNIELAAQQAAKDKEIKDLQQKVMDREKAREIRNLRRMISLEEDLKERQLRKRLWIKDRKIYKKGHEMKMRRLMMEKGRRKVNGELRKEIEQLKEYVRLLPIAKQKERRSEESKTINRTDDLFSL